MPRAYLSLRNFFFFVQIFFILFYASEIFAIYVFQAAESKPGIKIFDFRTSEVMNQFDTSQIWRI